MGAVTFAQGSGNCWQLGEMRGIGRQVNSANMVMYGAQNFVTPRPSTEVVTAFGIGNDPLNGPLAYTSYCFGYYVTHPKVGCADYCLTDII